MPTMAIGSLPGLAFTKGELTVQGRKRVSPTTYQFLCPLRRRNEAGWLTADDVRRPPMGKANHYKYDT
jgi:hypothetical protein